jgi:hypothetical protein
MRDNNSPDRRLFGAYLVIRLTLFPDKVIGNAPPPRDFDISPYFAAIKPTIEAGPASLQFALLSD